MLSDHEAEELDRLARFVTRPGPRFGLAMAICADAVLAADYRDTLSQRAAEDGRRVARVEFGIDDAHTDLVARVAEAGEQADAVFVVGLDHLVADGLGQLRKTSAIANLNQRRDELPQLWSARVVFWIGKSAYPHLTELAWDLCQVMLTTAEFERTRKVQVQAKSNRRQQQNEWVQLADERERPALEGQLETVTNLLDLDGDDLRKTADVAASAGELAVRLGDLDRAVQLLDKAANASEQLGETIDAAAQHRRIAQLQLYRGKIDEAGEQAERARELVERESLDEDDDELEAAEDEAAFDDLAAPAEIVETEAVAPEPEPAPAPSPGGPSFAPPAISRGAPARKPMAAVPMMRSPPSAAPRPSPVPEPSLAAPAAAPEPLEASERKPEQPHGKASLSLGFDLEREEATSTRENTGSVIDRSVLRETAEAELLVAEVELRRGQFDAAHARLHDTCLPAFVVLGDLRGQARVWGKLADILEQQGELEQARVLRSEHELVVYQQAQATLEVAQTQAKLADILARQGRLTDAISLLREQVVPAYQRLGDISDHTAALGQLAKLLEAAGQGEAATQIRRDRQAPLLEQQHDLRGQATAFEQRAREQSHQADHTAALESLRQGLEIHRKIGDVQAEADTLVQIADELVELGRIDEALELLEHQAVPILTKIGDSRGLAEARERIERLRQPEPPEPTKSREHSHRNATLAVFVAMLVSLAMAISFAWRGGCVSKDQHETAPRQP